MSAADVSGFSAEHLEREADREAGALAEDLVAPELGRHRKTPLGGAELRLRRSDLDQADRGVEAARHNRKAGVLSGETICRSIEHKMRLWQLRRVVMLLHRWAVWSMLLSWEAVPPV
jgi:hypothetical protein